MRWVYSGLLTALVPLYLARLVWRARRDRRYLAGLPERFGRLPAAWTAPPLWIHAVSVGEVRSVATLLAELAELAPEVPILLTTTTPAGRASALELFAQRVTVAYLPLDLPWTVARAAARARPRALLLVEGEYWPNLVHEMHSSGVPIWAVNARLTDRALRRYRRFRPFTAPVFAAVDCFAAQSERDARNLAGAGADPEKVRVAGSFKFDALDRVAGATDDGAEETVPARPPCLVLGSPRRGEERTLNEALRELLERFPELSVLAVPRQVGDAEFLADRMRAAGLRATVTHDAERADARAGEVVIIDEMGCLAQTYRRAAVAFVGGSLIPLGGHNVAEAALAGVPVVVGPHAFNHRQAIDVLSAVDALEVAADGRALAASVGRWLAAPDVAEAAGRRGRKAITELKGASRRVALMLHRAGLL